MNNFFFIHFYYFTFLSVPSLACASCFYSLIYEKTLKIMVRFRVILIFALCCFSLASQFTVLLCVDILLPLMLFVVAFILVSATTHLAFHNGFFFVLLVQVFYFSLENECIYNIGGDGISDGQIYWLAKWLFDLIHCTLKFFKPIHLVSFPCSREFREKKMKCDKVCQFAVFISTKPAVNRIWYKMLYYIVLLCCMLTALKSFKINFLTLVYDFKNYIKIEIFISCWKHCTSAVFLFMDR